MADSSMVQITEELRFSYFHKFSILKFGQKWRKDG